MVSGGNQDFIVHKIKVEGILYYIFKFRAILLQFLKVRDDVCNLPKDKEFLRFQNHGNFTSVDPTP